MAAVHDLMEQWAREGTTIGQHSPGKDYLRSFLAEYFFVARDAGHIAGFACARIMDNPGYAVTPAAHRVLRIEELFVQPAARQQGIGTALLHAVLQRARDRGVSTFHVFTATRNTDRILRFYRRHGFEPWGIQLYLSDAPGET